MNYYFLSRIGIILFIVGEIIMIKQGFVLWAIVIVADALVWAVVCQKVIQNKGYKEDWFWWGFWFNIFAFLIAISKPNNLNTNSDESTSKLSVWADEEKNKRIIREGGWKCNNCNKINYSGVVTCACGTNKTNKYEKIDKISEQYRLEDSGWKCNKCGKLNFENIFICRCGIKKSQNESIERENDISNKDSIEILKKYKELLDLGAITKEEFDKKKEELLDINIDYNI